jgi:hypothetical protein
MEYRTSIFRNNIATSRVDLTEFCQVVYFPMKGNLAVVDNVV